MFLEEEKRGRGRRGESQNFLFSLSSSSPLLNFELGGN
jgi:hypothetical protein